MNIFRGIRQRLKGDTIEVASKSGAHIGVAILEAAADWWDENNEEFVGKLKADGEVEIDLKLKVRLPGFTISVEDATAAVDVPARIFTIPERRPT